MYKKPWAIVSQYKQLKKIWKSNRKTEFQEHSHNRNFTFTGPKNN